MAKVNTTDPDVRLALLAGNFTANGSSAWVNMDGPFNVTIGAPGGATIALEKSFDGGTTAFPCARDTTGALATFTASCSLLWPEVETGVLYRLTMTGYVSGTIPYRLSR
jgi:hypothetical protein